MRFATRTSSTSTRAAAQASLDLIREGHAGEVINQHGERRCRLHKFEVAVP